MTILLSNTTKITGKDAFQQVFIIR